MPATRSTARLEACLNPEVYALLKRAAELQGQTLTDFVVNAAQASAQRIISEAEVIRLSLADQTRFAQTLLDPPAPNPALQCAFARRCQLLSIE